MTVLMFADRFVQRVKSGEKRHTIRGQRKQPIKPGDGLSLRHWSGKPYRSKQCVIHDVTCSEVWPIEISETGRVDMGDMILNHDEREMLAVQDGFKNFAEMKQWHLNAHGLPFTGVLIEWTVEKS